MCWTADQALHCRDGIFDHVRQIFLDPRFFFDIVFQSYAPFGANDSKGPNAGVRMIRPTRGEDELRRTAQHNSRATPVGKLASEQILLVCERLEPRILPGMRQKSTMEIVEADARRQSFPALGQAAEFERLHLGFRCFESLIRHP